MNPGFLIAAISLSVMTLLCTLSGLTWAVLLQGVFCGNSLALLVLAVGYRKAFCGQSWRAVTTLHP